nr:hypothetical protein Iba_scaffold47912CG0040 [Ipomoea batatas]GMD84087.1 hypothetical protein Iba_scaffold1588318CG0010 [Ipomoea batatas]
MYGQFQVGRGPRKGCVPLELNSEPKKTARIHSRKVSDTSKHFFKIGESEHFFFSGKPQNSCTTTSITASRSLLDCRSTSVEEMPVEYISEAIPDDTEVRSERPPLSDEGETSGSNGKTNFWNRIRCPKLFL